VGLILTDAGLQKQRLRNSARNYTVTPAQVTDMKMYRHPGESRDPLNRINRAALPAFHQFKGSRLSPG